MRQFGGAFESDKAQTQSQTLVGAAAMVSVLMVVSKLLGFAREAALAAAFGATATTDAYIVAQNIPYLLFSVIGSALTAVAVPVFVEYRNTAPRDEYERLVWSSGNVILLGGVLLSTAGIILAEPLTRLVAPGFDPALLVTATSLTRIMMFLILFYALSGWATGVLNAHQHFLAPASIGIPFNVICILGIFLGGLYKDIRWVAWATIIGVAAQFLIQVPPLVRRLSRYRWALVLSHPGLRKMAKLAVPVVIGVSSNQINTLVNRILASGLEPGSISALTYAQRVVQLPYGLLATPIIMVLYPSLANFASSGDWTGLRRALNRGLTSLALLCVPVTVGMLILRVDLIRFLFERGAFDATDTARTSVAFLFYGAGLLFIVWRDYLTRVCYAMNDSGTPTWTAVISTLVNIALSPLLMRRFGIAGLAGATTVAALVASLLLYLRIRTRLQSMDDSRLLWELAKITAASALMGLLLVAVRRSDPLHLFSLDRGGSTMDRFIRSGTGIILSGLLGAALYSIAAMAMRVQDMRYVFGFAQSLVKRIRPQPR